MRSPRGSRHTVTELDRVRRGTEALRRGVTAAPGRVMDEGQDSLSREFQYSTPAIVALAASIHAQPGVLGVRLQGGGWGGCLAVPRRRPTEAGAGG